mgnify:CR=1 FL=1
MGSAVLERDEYIRRWREAQRSIWWRYVVPLLPFTWGTLGVLVVFQPSGRFGVVCWFLWASLFVAQVAAVGAVVYAGVRAGDAQRYPLIWKNDYMEPWLVKKDWTRR